MADSQEDVHGSFLPYFYRQSWYRKNSEADRMKRSVTEAVLNSAPFGVAVVEGTRIAWINDWLADILGKPHGDLVGQTLDDPELASSLQTLFTDPDPVTLDAAGARSRRLKRIRMRIGHEGCDAYFFEDVTELLEIRRKSEKLMRKVRTLEIRDPGTGVLNRKAILKVLESEVSRSRRYNNPLALLRFSLRLGADGVQGDLLPTVAEELRDQLRWVDQIGMLDEATFLIVLPETSLVDSERLATQLSRRVGTLVADRFQGGVALGTAEWRKGDDARKLLERLHNSCDSKPVSH